MQFKINKKLLHDFRGAQIGVVLATDINNDNNPTAFELCKEQQRKTKRGFTDSDLKAHPHIAPWREAYRAFGAKPKKYLSSVETMVTRACSTELRSFSALVDLYNYISLKYLLPVGGKDIDTISGDLQLTYATDNERTIHLLGEHEAKAPKEGEVIYKDEEGAVVRRWNWKEADRTKLTDDTTNAVLFLELLPPVAGDLLRQATNELAFLIADYCGGNVAVAFLDEHTPEVSLSDGDALALLDTPQAQDTAFDVFAHSADTEREERESAEHTVRVDKVHALEHQGVHAWPQLRSVDATVQQAAHEFRQDEHKHYHLAGRVMSFREHGKTAFADIKDRSGTIQVYFKQDVVGRERFEFIKRFIDLGDSVWVSGKTFKTNTGEITLAVDECALLAKCLRPLPEKFHGLTDVEVRYRQRYLDLITNEESRERFCIRSNMTHFIRNYLVDHGFMEVETPMLHSIPGGAVARPFVTHHNALRSDFYLRIAPELYLKRLVVGGFERVFEINRSFRNEGISTRHNPEFTMLEAYMAYHDYQYMMDFIEDMLRRLVSDVCDSTVVPFKGKTIDFEKPFQRMSVMQAIATYAGIPEQELQPTTIDAHIKKHNVTFGEKKPSWGKKLFSLFEELVEEQLFEPVFITHHPVDVSPLAKRDYESDGLAARFELFIGGMELSNGFNELNNPFEQAERFKEQVAAHADGDDEAHRFDGEYITALEYGLPPTVGVGIGIDRLAMLLTNTTSIKDVILFPTLKKRND